MNDYVQDKSFSHKNYSWVVYNLESMNKFGFDQVRLDKVCRKYDVIAVYVHGSRVKGYAALDSDTDVAIVVRDISKSKAGSWGIYEVASEIEDVLSGLREPDVRVVDKDSSPVFLFEVISGGVCVYEKTSEDRVRFESEVMRMYYDTARIHDIYRKYLYASVKEGTYAN